MQFLYGDKNVLRALDEADFWKQQEAEHTTVIRLVTPELEPQFVKSLMEFQRSFNMIYGYIKRYIESITRSKGDISDKMKDDILELLDYCKQQSQHFIKLLEEMLANSRVVQKSSSSQTVINHIMRESQYFIGIVDLINP